MSKMQTSVARPKVGLALGGGSTFGIAHIGVLKALAEKNIPIDFISGTSAGAIVASCFAFGMSIEQMTELTKSLSWKKFSRFGRSKMGLRSNEPMEAFITDALGKRRIEDAQLPLAIVATDIETRSMVVLREGALHDAIRASTAMPGMFVPVEVDGKLLVDGGLTENVPVTAVKEMGATYIIAVNLSTGFRRERRPTNMMGVVGAALSLFMTHRDKNLREYSDVLIEPELAGFSMSKFKDADAILEKGYEATLRAMPLLEETLHLPIVDEQEESARHSWFSRIKQYVQKF